VVESVRRYDAGSSITLVALDEAAAEEGRSLGLSNLLIGRDSLGTADLGRVDVALVWACSDAETCELGRQLRSAGVPMVVGLSASTGEALSRGGCGFDAVVAAWSLRRECSGELGRFRYLGRHTDRGVRQRLR
jgi:hypothetical protein